MGDDPLIILPNLCSSTSFSSCENTYPDDVDGSDVEKSVHVRARPKGGTSGITGCCAYPVSRPATSSETKVITEEEVVLEITFCSTVFIFFLTAKSFKAAFDDG